MKKTNLLLFLLLCLTACNLDNKNKKIVSNEETIDINSALLLKQAFAKPIIKPLKTLFKDSLGAFHYTIVLLKGTATQQWQTVKYPIFEGENVEQLNNCVLKMFIDDGEPTKTIEQAFLNNIKSMQMSVNESEMSSDFYMQDSFHVINNTPKLLSLCKWRTFWDGSAHDLFAIHFQNINPSTFKTYQISDFFLPNTKQKLAQIGEQHFRKDFLVKNNYDPNTPLSKCCCFNSGSIKEQRDDIFYLSADFVFTRKSIKFVYQNYEIMAFGAGIPEFTIPFHEIQHLLKPEWKAVFNKGF